MSELDDRRIRWRLRRGMRELDLMLEHFHAARAGSMTPEQKNTLAKLLECEDDILWDWLNGRSRPDSTEFEEMVNAIRGHAFD